MRRTKTIIMVAAWLAVISAGAWWQLGYEYTPGRATATPVRYSDQDLIVQRSGHGLIVMALHPRCPCSRASLAEFEQVAAKAQPRFDIIVLACVPPEASADWTESDNCSRARAIPGVRLTPDPGGRTAAELGMKTSGHVVAYDEQRRLIFSGGITSSRGQTGPNAGLTSLMTITDNRAIKANEEVSPVVGREVPTTAVFGCALVSPGSCPAECGEETQ